jgi:hypothetical protein
MPKKFLYFMFPLALFIALGMSFSTVFSKDENSSMDKRIGPKSDNQGGVSWQKPIQQKGLTIIPGSAQASFGRLELRWIIGPGTKARLVTLESPGAGEMPPLEKKIFVLVRDDGTTLLFQEWIPLANQKKPVTIRDIVSVGTNELFSVLPGKGVPPEAPISKKIPSIHWGRQYQRNGVQYLPGELNTSWFGRQNIYWMKKSGRIPELYSPENQKQDSRNEAAPGDSKLYLWLDEMNGATGLFLENGPETRNGNTSYLWPFAVVDTDQLISGFQEIQGGQKPKSVSDNNN